MNKFSFSLLAILMGAASSSAEIVLSEDFNKFTHGSEDSPATAITDYDAITATPGWTGLSVCEAGGCAYMPVGSQLATPQLDLGANGGNYFVSFKAKSATPGAFFFLMDSNNGYMSGDITDEWATYTVTLPTGSGPSMKAEPTIIYFYAYTDMLIDDIIIDDSGVAVPAALPSTDFKFDSFTANWQTSLNAESYILNVFTLDYDVTTTVFSRKYIVKDKEVNETSFVVERDDFATPYYYTVAAKSGNAVSGESNMITVAPDAVESVTALSPSDISTDSFTAKWTSSALASQYYLHLIRRHEALNNETFAIIDTDFSDIISDGTVDAPQKELEWLFKGDWFANMPVIADGIIGINNQDIDFFGQAYLQSPAIDLTPCNGEINVSFTAFSRKGLKNASVKLCNYSPSLTFVDISDFTVSDNPETFNFKLSGGSKASCILITSEDSGMMFIDDLKVTVDLPASSAIVLPIETLITDETYATIDRAGLPSEDQIAYYVRASWAVSHKDGEVRQIPEVISEPSNYVWVEQNASIDDIQTDDSLPDVIYADGAINISDPEKRPVSVYTLTGNCISHIECPDTRSKISVKPGIYIIRVGSHSLKLYAGPHF